MEVTLEDLMEAGVHIGHQLKRWNPKSKKYLYDIRHGISIIDLEETETCLKKACDFLEQLVIGGKAVLFVGTKRQAQEAIRETSAATQMPFCVHRWLGGTLTNFPTIRTSLNKYKRFLDMENNGELAKLPKKEISMIRREMDRMHRNFEGILDIDGLPGALVVIDINNEKTAVAEAKRLGIPVVGLVDTNSDPSLIDYPIPGNDDAVKSVRIILSILQEAIQRGIAQRPEKAKRKFRPVRTQQPFAQGEASVTVSADIQLENQELVEDKENPRESSKEWRHKFES